MGEGERLGHCEPGTGGGFVAAAQDGNIFLGIKMLMIGEVNQI